MKHIELKYPSLAEVWAHLRGMITIQDLCHSAKVVIDIDLDSPFDDSCIRIPDYTEKIKPE